MSTPQNTPQFGFLQHRVGDVIKSRYEVLDHLGGGNFGSVYRVRDRVVGNILACKEMHVLNHPDTLVDERQLALDLFKREALNLATLRHPHIPAAYFEVESGAWRICPRCGLDYQDEDVCPLHGATLLDVDERFYLMMDFIDGATLEDLAVEYSKQRGRPLPEADCVEWIAQVASALRSLHLLGVVHRDVKPDNIKIRVGDGAAILLDFGLTKKVEEAGLYGTVRQTGTGRLGTPGYAPPDSTEQQSPEARSDIYALGMTLLRLLTARDPQDADDLHDLKTHAPRYFNARISPEVEAIIQKSTAHKAGNRYVNVDELLTELNEMRVDETSSTRVPPFTFADGFKVRNTNDLTRAVETYPNEAQNYLWNGMFGEWLQAQGLAAPATSAQNAIARFPQNPQRALEIFRRALQTGKLRDDSVLPKLKIEPPLLNFGSIPSGDKRILQLRVLNVGAGLSWGTIEIEGAKGSNANVSRPTLPGLIAPAGWEGNDENLSIEIDTSASPLGGHSGAILLKTEDVVMRVAVSYTVQPLQLHLVPPTLDFGDVPLGTKRALSLTVRKSGERKTDGEPRGLIYRGDLENIDAPERFSSEDPFDITIDATSRNAVAQGYSGVLHLDTNGGRLRIPIRYRIAMPTSRALLLLILPIIVGALSFGALRLLYGVLEPSFATRWLLDENGVKDFEVRAWGMLFVGATLGLVGGARLAFVRRVDSFWQSVCPALGALFGMAGSYALAFAMHWGVWVAGDWILHPIVAQFAPRVLDASLAAPLSWTTFGGIIGFGWGLQRLLFAIGKRGARPLMLLFGVALLLFLVLNAMVATG